VFQDGRHSSWLGGVWKASSGSLSRVFKTSGRMNGFASYAVSFRVTDWAEVFRSHQTSMHRAGPQRKGTRGSTSRALPYLYAVSCVEIRRSTLMLFSLHLGQRVMPIQPYVSKTKLHPCPYVFLGVLLGMKIERAGKRSRRRTLTLHLRAPVRPSTFHNWAKQAAVFCCGPLKLRSVRARMPIGYERSHEQDWGSRPFRS